MFISIQRKLRFVSYGSCQVLSACSRSSERRPEKRYEWPVGESYWHLRKLDEHLLSHRVIKLYYRLLVPNLPRKWWRFQPRFHQWAICCQATSDQRRPRARSYSDGPQSGQVVSSGRKMTGQPSSIFHPTVTPPKLARAHPQLSSIVGNSAIHVAYESRLLTNCDC